MKSNLLLLLLSIIWLSCRNNKTIIEGQTHFPTFQFISLYELPESKRKDYLDSIQLWKQRVISREDWFWEAVDLNQVQYIEDNELTFKPCIIVKDKDQNRKTVYLSENDYEKIRQKNEEINNLQTYESTWVELEVKELKHKIFTCEKIISLSSKDLMPEEALHYEEDIEIEPPSFTATDVEDIYLKTGKGKNLKNIDSVFHYLETQFIEMEKGNRPIEFPVYDNQRKLKISEKELEEFMDILKSEYDKKNSASDKINK